MKLSTIGSIVNGIELSALFSVLLVAGSSQAFAQVPVPLLHSVFPPGAQAGTTVEVAIDGVFLEGASDLILSDPALGVRCEAIPDELSPGYTTRFRLTIPSGASPGTYDLFARCRLGLSAPRPFVIGSGREVIEPEGNNSRERAHLLQPETVVNGTASENSNDFYRIDAKAGQRFVITCRAENLDSRMDATLILCDKEGNEIDRDRNNRNRNAVVSLNAPRDGSYFLRVADFTYGGGNSYPYRLSLTTAPHLEFVFPPAGKPGSTGSFTLYGYNLPGSDPARKILSGNRLLETKEVQINLPADSLGTHRFGPAHSSFIPHMSYRLTANGISSNALPISTTTSPTFLAREENGDSPQEIAIPCEIHGRFDRTRDRDHFHFSAKKDEVTWVAVLSERIGASADPAFRIERITTNGEGVQQFQQVAIADDLGNDPGERYFPLPCRDAEITFKAPEDGLYRLTLLNQTGSGGADQIYRLILREPRPGFDLIAIPWERTRVANRVDIAMPNLSPGGTVELRVLALRHEGFSGEIDLSVEGLPPGVTSPPVKMGTGRSATLTILATPEAHRWDGMIVIRGTSGNLSREARLGTTPWPIRDWSKQFFETRLGPRVPLSVTGDDESLITLEAPGENNLELVVGEKLELPVKLLRQSSNTGEFTIRAEGLPHKTGELKLSGSTEQGNLIIGSGKENEFPREPGSWTFRLRAEGKARYQPSKATADHARVQHQSLVARKRTHADHLEKLTATRDQISQQLDEAEREIDSGGSPDAPRHILDLRSQLDEAYDQLAAAREKAEKLQQAVLSAAAAVKSANDLVKARDVQIVIYSDPITVRVTPAPPTAAE
ncbi:MAG: hypothetical protein CMP28_04265 [Roseibacillus sp.]|nr:hypothetical protein [Roseibacillus sp.]